MTVVQSLCGLLALVVLMARAEDVQTTESAVPTPTMPVKKVDAVTGDGAKRPPYFMKPQPPLKPLLFLEDAILRYLLAFAGVCVVACLYGGWEVYQTRRVHNYFEELGKRFEDDESTRLFWMKVPKRARPLEWRHLDFAAD